MRERVIVQDCGRDAGQDINPYMVSYVICSGTRSASNEWRKDQRMRCLYSSNETAGNWDITVGTVYNKDNRHLCSATNPLVSKVV